MIRRRALIAFAALTLLLSAPGSVLAVAIDQQVTATPGTFDVCTTSDYSCAHTIATVAVQAGVGRYRLTSSVALGSATDTVYAMAQVGCTLDGVVPPSPFGSVAQYQNLLVAESFTMTPRLVIDVDHLGDLVCTLNVRGWKGQPAGNTYQAQSGFIRIAGPFLSGSDNVPLASHQVLRGSTSLDVFESSHGISTSTSWVALYGDAYVTSCQNTTGDGSLGCTSTDNSASYTDYTSQIVVAQYPYTSGTWCNYVAGPVTSYHITDARHHMTSYTSLAYSPKAGCSSSLKVILRLTRTGGSALGVSAGSTLLVVVPQ
jgi:hypothetical protein